MLVSIFLLPLLKMEEVYERLFYYNKNEKKKQKAIGTEASDSAIITIDDATMRRTLPLRHSAM